MSEASEPSAPGEAEARPAPATITPYRDGPYLVRGEFAILDQDGRQVELRRRTIALCRCGRSAIKPFCDGTHKATGFRASSRPQSRPNGAGAQSGQARGADARSGQARGNSQQARRPDQASAGSAGAAASSDVRPLRNAS